MCWYVVMPADDISCVYTSQLYIACQFILSDVAVSLRDQCDKCIVRMPYLLWREGECLVL